MASFFSWIFDNNKPGTLVLHADKTAHTLPGFQTGQPLTLHASRSDETVGELLDKLNTYRGPDQQIKTIWDSHGSIIDKDTKVTHTIHAIVKSV